MTTTQRTLPFGPVNLLPFTEGLFDREEEKAARILWSNAKNLLGMEKAMNKKREQLEGAARDHACDVTHGLRPGTNGWPEGKGRGVPPGREKGGLRRV